MNGFAVCICLIGRMGFMWFECPKFRFLDLWVFGDVAVDNFSRSRTTFLISFNILERGNSSEALLSVLKLSI